MTAHCTRTETRRPPTLGRNPLKDTTTGDRSANPATPPRQRRRPAQLCHAHATSSASASSRAPPSYSLSLSASLMPSQLHSQPLCRCPRLNSHSLSLSVDSTPAHRPPLSFSVCRVGVLCYSSNYASLAHKDTNFAGEICTI
ncbi:hypothetical protein FH972_001413 [Carpinus fangiana]|uniref:Uncharacterized protein n=1 Tax=Carpinus fangiana TaxID=176857 RepID=A0A5N6QEA4_9ROSI|nr:hypothetical protein FH972_001413 [Carpinus fangiana]